jgi:hypothetical protein
MKKIKVLLLAAGVSFACVPPAPTVWITQPCTSYESNTDNTKEELADELRAVLASPEGCSGAGQLFADLKKAGGTSDYYYYKAYCYGDSNPEKACSFYNRFLKVARSDTRAAQAKQFINSQDPGTYTTCVLP